MKEIVKSKYMVGFMIFVIGFTYINSIQLRGMNEIDNKNEIVFNK
jgi:hypothetical protein